MVKSDERKTQFNVHPAIWLKEIRIATGNSVRVISVSAGISTRTFRLKERHVIVPTNLPKCHHYAKFVTFVTKAKYFRISPTLNTGQFYLSHSTYNNHFGGMNANVSAANILSTEITLSTYIALFITAF
jgi:hypothetical protein